MGKKKQDKRESKMSQSATRKNKNDGELIESNSGNTNDLVQLVYQML